MSIKKSKVNITLCGKVLKDLQQLGKKSKDVHPLFTQQGTRSSSLSCRALNKIYIETETTKQDHNYLQELYYI